MDYDPLRYSEVDLVALRTISVCQILPLMKRGSIAKLIALREAGGICLRQRQLCELEFGVCREDADARRKATEITARGLAFGLQLFGLDAARYRLVLRLWAHWPEISERLAERASAARDANRPLLIPDLEDVVALVKRASHAIAAPVPAALPTVKYSKLPTEGLQLQALVHDLSRQN